MRKSKSISIVSAQYIEGYKVRIMFSDNTWQAVDFEPFLFAHSRGYYDKYRKPTIFKRFKVEKGNLVWGKDWDLIFPLDELYKGEIRFNEKRVTSAEFRAYLEKE